MGRFEPLQPRIEEALVNILVAEIDLHKRVKLQVRDLKKQRDFNVYDAFRSIDRFNEGFINEGNLSDFFKTQGVVLTSRELFCIIRRLNTHGDAKISIEEFAYFLGESVFELSPSSQSLSKPKQQQPSFLLPHRAR